MLSQSRDNFHEIGKFFQLLRRIKRVHIEFSPLTWLNLEAEFIQGKNAKIDLS